MKSRLLILLAVLAWLGSATAALGVSSQAADQASPGAEATGTPVVVVPQYKYEFKPVVDGSELTHGYPIKNTGDAVLAIQRVRTG